MGCFGLIIMIPFQLWSVYTPLWSYIFDCPSATIMRFFYLSYISYCRCLFENGSDNAKKKINGKDFKLLLRTVKAFSIWLCTAKYQTLIFMSHSSVVNIMGHSEINSLWNMQQLACFYYKILDVSWQQWIFLPGLKSNNLLTLFIRQMFL